MDIFFTLLFFVIFPLMSVNCACDFEISKERIPSWKCALWGSVISMGFFMLHDIFIAEHHPHIPRFLVFLLAPIVGALMLLPSLVLVLIRRKTARLKTTKDHTKQS